MKKLFKMVFAALTGMVCRKEYREQKYNINERPVEYSFLFKMYARKMPKTVMDVGSGATALPHLLKTCGAIVTATDNIKDYWPNGMTNRHFHVINDDITASRLTGKYDMITCISVLEHIKDYESAVKNMFSLLKPSGWLILTCPYNEEKYCQDVYKLPESSQAKITNIFITQAYCREQLMQWLEKYEGRIVEQEYWRFFDGEYWTCGQRVTPPVQALPSEKHQISCICIEKV